MHRADLRCLRHEAPPARGGHLLRQLAAPGRAPRSEKAKSGRPSEPPGARRNRPGAASDSRGFEPVMARNRPGPACRAAPTRAMPWTAFGKSGGRRSCRPSPCADPPRHRWLPGLRAVAGAGSTKRRAGRRRRRWIGPRPGLCPGAKRGRPGPREGAEQAQALSSAGGGGFSAINRGGAACCRMAISSCRLSAGLLPDVSIQFRA